MSIKNANAENYNELIKDGFKIVDFYSTTCVPCKAFARLLEDTSMELPFIDIVKVNITDYPLIGKENNVEAVPTVLFMKNGVQVDREVGLLSEEELTEKISRHYYGE